MSNPGRPRIGLALGGGAARGWAHIGVIRALEEAGIRPDVVAGTSIGALVGGAYAAGRLDWLEQWVGTLARREVFSLLDFGLGSGMIRGDKLMAFLATQLGECDIEDLECDYGATATVLQTGAEVWLRSGPLLDAIRASIALPALLPPVTRGGQLLADGGLVNPVPISVARAMEADVVIAVDLASDIVGRTLQPPEPKTGNDFLQWLGNLRPGAGATAWRPSMLSVVMASIDIMQVRITRSRMAGDPPDIAISPRIGHMGIMDFHLAADAIQAGREAVSLAMPALRASGLAVQPDLQPGSVPVITGPAGPTP